MPASGSRLAHSALRSISLDREEIGVVAVRDQRVAVRVHRQHALRAVDLALGEHDQPLGLQRPRAQPLRPREPVRPAQRVGLDRLQHQQLGAVQVADDRHVGRRALGGLVQRREVMQVQHVGVRGARGLQRPRPRRHLMLGVVGVQQPETAVGRAGTVLVGRVHRRVRGHRVAGFDRARHVDGADIDVVVEAAGVAVSGHAAGEDRGVPAHARERMREIPRDVRGPATRVKEQSHQDAGM